MNPYLSRVMLAHPSQFFGRSRELRHIFSRIGAVRPQSVSIVGERRIGKSSLLNAVTWTETQGQYSGGNDSLVITFLDFQRHPSLTPERFFQLLTEEVCRRCPELSIPSCPAYETLGRILGRLDSAGKGLVLLLDEFDGITANAAFGSEFYAYLRSVANSSPVAYVTSSRVELGKICHSSDIADSPFFNIFSNLYLRPFQPDEALGLIRVPSEREGCPLEPYAPRLLALAGRFPFYLQIACCLYFDALSESPNAEPNHEELRERFLEEAASHFEYHLEHCDDAERRVLSGVARGEKMADEDRHIGRKLLRGGYLTEDDTGFRLFSEAYAEYLQRSGVLSQGGARLAGVGETAQWEDFAGRSIHQYRVLEKAGEGGMGLVFAAEDTFLGRRVALKVCRPELMRNASLQKRILREAKLAASLSHPSIVAVYELFEYSGQIVLIMEWIEGTNLQQILQRRGPLPWREAVGLILQAAQGLDAAHQVGVIHRDIKPSNLMVDAGGRVRLTDFGLAKGLSDNSGQLTGTGVLVGTLDYMSPEQVLGNDLDHRSDLFSLGTVLFEAITGQTPFRRSSVHETMNAIVQDDLPSLARYSVPAPGELDRILRTLMGKRPHERYDSAADFCGELRGLLAGERKRRFAWIPFLWGHHG